jgi:hypothetical protein
MKSFDVSALTGAGLDTVREYLAGMAASSEASTALHA